MMKCVKRYLYKAKSLKMNLNQVIQKTKKSPILVSFIEKEHKPNNPDGAGASLIYNILFVTFDKAFELVNLNCFFRKQKL